MTVQNRLRLLSFTVPEMPGAPCNGQPRLCKQGTKHALPRSKLSVTTACGNHRARTPCCHMRTVGCQEDGGLQALAKLRGMGLLARSCDTADVSPTMSNRCGSPQQAQSTFVMCIVKGLGDCSKVIEHTLGEAWHADCNFFAPCPGRKV